MCLLSLFQAIAVLSYDQPLMVCVSTKEGSDVNFLGQKYFCASKHFVTSELCEQWVTSWAKNDATMYCTICIV